MKIKMYLFLNICVICYITELLHLRSTNLFIFSARDTQSDINIFKASQFHIEDSDTGNSRDMMSLTMQSSCKLHQEAVISACP